MVCSVQDLREREIINLKDGARLGSVCDVEIDTLSGSIAVSYTHLTLPTNSLV